MELVVGSFGIWFWFGFFFRKRDAETRARLLRRNFHEADHRGKIAQSDRASR